MPLRLNMKNSLLFLTLKYVLCLPVYVIFESTKRNSSIKKIQLLKNSALNMTADSHQKCKSSFPLYFPLLSLCLINNSAIIKFGTHANQAIIA